MVPGDGRWVRLMERGAPGEAQFHTPARLTWTSRYWRVHLTEAELRDGLLPRALEALADSGLRGPPARAA